MAKEREEDTLIGDLGDDAPGGGGDELTGAEGTDPVVMTADENCAGVEVTVTEESDEDDDDKSVVLSGSDDVMKVILRRKDSNDPDEGLPPPGATKARKRSFIKIRLEEEDEVVEQMDEVDAGEQKAGEDESISQCPYCMAGLDDATDERWVLIG